MRRPPIRVLDLAGSPEAMGAWHGATYRDEIRAYTAERVNLACSPLWSGGVNGKALSRADIVDLAHSMVAAHEAHSPALAAEMLAMADAAGITPAEAVIVGGFTDFVDTVRAAANGPHPDRVIEDDCTAVIVPDTLAADGAGIYGQTWDMHDTATDYVVLLRIKPDDAPASLIFTTTGALGQIGMNELGVCIGINNLTAIDGRPGVTWPQVVRHALEQESATAARDAIMAADLAGGHNFLLFDAGGVGYSIEAMPSVRTVDDLTRQHPIVHTNHTLRPETTAVEGQRSPALVESSQRRLRTAHEFLGRPATGGPGAVNGQTPDHAITMDDVIALTREPSAICQVAVDPYRVESSGGTVMRPKSKDFRACWGLPSDNDYQRIDFPG